MFEKRARRPCPKCICGRYVGRDNSACGRRLRRWRGCSKVHVCGVRALGVAMKRWKRRVKCSEHVREFERLYLASAARRAAVCKTQLSRVERTRRQRKVVEMHTEFGEDLSSQDRPMSQ